MDKSFGNQSPGKSTGTDSAKQGSSSLEDVFQYFAKFGEIHSDGQTITLNIDKWLQQANLMGGKSKITGVAMFGETHSDAQTITLENIEKWLQQANLMGGKSKISGADTANTFAKVAKLNKRINLDEFKEFIENLANDKKMDWKSMLDKLVAAGQPEPTNVTSPGKSTGTDSAKEGSSSLEDVFQYFAKFGETHSDGQTITLENIDKWLQQANLMGGKSKIIGADTAITFAKVAKLNKRINLDEFKEFIENLANDKKMDSKSMLDQLVAAGQPEPTNVTKVVSSGTVGAIVNRLIPRLTRLFTGSHTERFDEEGRGRGIEEREDIIDDSGYVQGFKSKDKSNDDNNKNKKT